MRKALPILALLLVLAAIAIFTQRRTGSGVSTGFGASRAQSRQIVRHGHIDVNGRKCNIPSAQVKIGDVVSVRESSKNNATILGARDATAHAPAPNWIDVDREGLKGRITSLPQRSDLVQIQLNEQLIVELYSK